MIVETTDNRLYSVSDDANYPQCWVGYAVKRTKAGYVPKAKARLELVRKEGSRIVAAA